MKSLRLYFVVFSLFLFTVLGVCEVFGQMVRIKHHPVYVENDAVGKAKVIGSTKKHRFGDIVGHVYYNIHDAPNDSWAKSTVFSSVSMQALTVAFRGFASISGTADAGHTQQFSGAQKGAVKTDAGVLDKAGYKQTNKFTVQTSLVEASGRPIELDKSRLDAYNFWHGKVPKKQQQKWGGSEGFSYKHTDKSFYTAMKEHPVHFGGGFDLGRLLTLRNPTRKGRDLDLSQTAEHKKQKVGTPTNAQIIAMFDPYARAHGEAFNEAGNSMEKTVPSVTVNTTQPHQPPKSRNKADAGDYNYGILFAVNDVYTATAGDIHEAVMYLSHIASSVKWYVGSTFMETDSNTNEAYLSWRIPDDASGDYVIKAEVTPSNSASYEARYTLSVSSVSSSSQAGAPTLSPSNGLYTAVAGDLHTANVTAPEAIYSVSLYIAGPGETGRGAFAGSTPGDGSATTAALDYTFPSGVSGEYQITAAVYKHSDMSLLGEVSYTVSVSLPTTTTPTPSVSLVSSDGLYTASAGNGHKANLTLSAAPSYIFWYVQGPGDASPVLQSQDTSGSLTSTLRYSFPSGVSGDYIISVSGTSATGGAAITASYIVSVSLPTPTTSPSAGNLLGTLESGTTKTVSVGNTATIYYSTQGEKFYSSISLYFTPPGESSETYVDTKYANGIDTYSATFRYVMPTDATTGDWTFTVYVSLQPTGWYKDTFTITVTD